MKDYESIEHLFMDVEMMAELNYSFRQKTFLLEERLRTDRMRIQVFELMNQFLPTKTMNGLLPVCDYEAGNKKLNHGDSHDGFTVTRKENPVRTRKRLLSEAIEDIVKEKLLQSFPRSSANTLRMECKITLNEMIRRTQLLTDTSNKPSCVAVGSEMEEVLKLLKDHIGKEA